MSTHNICLYKEVDKKYTACNLKTTKSLDCALIGVCAVIRSNTVCFCGGLRNILILFVVEKKTTTTLTSYLELCYETEYFNSL